MKFVRKSALALPGVTGTARVGRTAEVLTRLKPGDVAVVDHVDLDRDTAQALVATGARIVVNASPFISGRYANAGAEVLAAAGVLLVDQIGPTGMAHVPDGQLVRVHGATLHAVPPGTEQDDTALGEVLATGRDLDMDAILEQMAAARTGLVAQMDTISHTTSEFLRQELEMLLDGQGLPQLTTVLSGRAVVVVARADHDELQALRTFVREQTPALVAVGSAADDLLAESWVPDVIVVTAGDHDSVPSADALTAAKDVVLLSPLGSTMAELVAIEKAGVTPHLVDTSAAAEDIALLVADRDGAELMVGVGLHARLEDFLDQQQHGRASTFATRLKVGSRLVDAAAVRALYAGRPRPAHVGLVLLAGLVALLAALSVTAVGREWVDDLVATLQGLM